MPDVRIRINVEALQSVAIGGAYATLGTLSQPSRCLVIYNDSTANITISYDGGVTDNQVLAPSATFVFDISSNRVADCDFVFKKGTVIQVKGSGAGTAYLTSFYAE